MKMKQKIKRLLACTLAFAMLMTLSVVTEAQAAVKLNKKSASIYAGETVQLKLSGAKTVSWGSSNKKIATVTSKGLVKGVKKGTANIKAMDKKTKKTYTCKVTVKAVKSLGITEDDIFVPSGGMNIFYNGKKIDGAIYLLDGKKIKTDEDSIWSGENGDGVVITSILLDEKLSYGEHTFAIQKKGYKTITKTFVLEEVKIDGLFAEESFVSDNILWIFCNPEVDGKDYNIILDGKEVEPIFTGINGDGYFTIQIDASGLSTGEHTVTVTAEGFPEGNVKVTI